MPGNPPPARRAREAIAPVRTLARVTGDADGEEDQDQTSIRLIIMTMVSAGVILALARVCQPKPGD
jgi:hypothetical protein